MTLEWISIGNGEWETPDGWWVRYDDYRENWEYGYRGLDMGWSESADDAKDECARIEGNSR